MSDPNYPKDIGDEFKPGDFINGGNRHCPMKYEILAISGEWAWVRSARDIDTSGTLYRVENLMPWRDEEDRAQVEIMTSVIGSTGLLSGLECERVARALRKAGCGKQSKG